MKLKKMAAMVMAAVLSVSVLAGCGGGGGGTTGGVITQPADVTVLPKTADSIAIAEAVKTEIKNQMGALEEEIGYQWGGFVDVIPLDEYLKNAVQKWASLWFDISSEDSKNNTCMAIASEMMDEMNLDVDNHEIIDVNLQPADEIDQDLIESEAFESYIYITMLAPGAKKDGIDLVCAYDVVPAEIDGVEYYITTLAIVNSENWK